MRQTMFFTYKVRNLGPLFLVWLAMQSNLALGAELTADEIAFFESNVRPLLVDQCQKCHGSGKQWGGLRLDSRESVQKGGESGSPIIPGKPDESLLITAIRRIGDASAMPPEGKLKPSEVAALVRWVEMGAPWPDSPESTSKSNFTKSLWSLQSIHVAEPPAVDAGQSSVKPRKSLR